VKKGNKRKMQRTKKSSKEESFKQMHVNNPTFEDGHVEKDSENQHNKAARRRKHNLQYPLYIYSAAGC
jgi:hypothetical protein